MEAGRGILSPPPPPPNLPRTHLRNPHSSASVLMSHDQATRAITSIPTTSIVRHFAASVLSQEQQNDYKTCVLREEKMVQATLDRRHVEGGLPFCGEREKDDFDKCLKYFERRLLYQLVFWYPFPAPYTEEKTYSSMSMESIVSDANVVAGSEPMKMEQNSPSSVSPGDVLALAKKAMMASRKAALLAEKSNILSADFGQSNFLGLDPDGSTKEILIIDSTVRSKRLLERQSKKRKISKKPNNFVCEVSSAMTTDIRKKIEKGLNPDNPLRFFLFGPETTQLLTVKEEKDLFLNIQELMRLEEVKQRIQVQFRREPTLAEWSQAVGMSCRVLQSCLHSGNRSREKMIYANFRLVIHVAKQYEGKGINLQDLLQEGSRGLMKSLEKFKPKAGCRFPTYAYWWIRQSIRKAIFQNSRTIRLPENVFALLKKIKNARRLCIQEEGHLPTNEELAKRVGIRVEKLESLLLTSRNPVSIQERPWLDQDVTFQEITADPEVEIPDLVIAKKMMRQHVRNLLGVLSRRERQIIQFRYGIRDGERKSLSEIGAMYGLSKERVRQLESRALDKLRECLASQGLEAYIDLLV